MQLSFVVTDKCNIACAFCAPDCSPAVGGHLSAVDMLRIVDEAAAMSDLSVIVFTGGEPMLYQDEIIPVLRDARRRNGIPCRIVTNGFWATSPRTAARILGGLREAGLTEINFSVDDFHQDHIPLDRIKHAVAACLEFDIPVVLAHKSYPGSRSDLEFYRERLGVDISPLDEEGARQDRQGKVLFSGGYTVPIGRGAESVDKMAWTASAGRGDCWKGPCQEVFRRITVSSRLSLVPCCGLVERELDVFYFGDLSSESLSDCLDRANASLVYNWLALEGASGMMDFVRRIDPSITFRDAYVQNCEACNDLFKNKRAIEVLNASLDAVQERILVLRAGWEALRGYYVAGQAAESS